MKKRENILVTGGLGYIGSHTIVKLYEQGYNVVIVDNLSNSKISTLNTLKYLCSQDLKYEIIDVRDVESIKNLLKKYEIRSVVHFAAFKSVSESIKNPEIYYDNNVGGLISLLQAIGSSEVVNLVFSSSCTVYGVGSEAVDKYSESEKIEPISPYGRTKLMCENILKNKIINEKGNLINIGVLRYFNPVGAHSSYLIGDNPIEEPSCLMPRLGWAAIGRLKKIEVFGTDYDTPDGSCIRDFIHVDDVAEAHISSLKTLKSKRSHICNIGTGVGYSVLDVIREFEKQSGVKLPVHLGERRSGDIPRAVANTNLSEKILGWKSKIDLAQMCISAWEWQKRNK